MIYMAMNCSEITKRENKVGKRPKEKALGPSKIMKSGGRGGTSKESEGMPNEEEESQDRVCPGSQAKKLFQRRGSNQPS